MSSQLQMNGSPTAPCNVSAMNASLDRAHRENAEVQRNPSVGNKVISVLSVLAALGTIIGLALELADTFRSERK